MVTMPSERSSGSVTFPMPGMRRMGSGARNLRLATRQNVKEPVGFRLVGGDFGNEVGSRKADRAIQVRPFLDGADQPVGAAKRRTVQPLATGEIKISLIDRNHLDHGREFFEDPVDLARILTVLVMLAAQENRVRAELLRRANRHG